MGAKLFEELRRRGTPTYLYCLLRDYCRGREVTFMTAGGVCVKGDNERVPAWIGPWVDPVEYHDGHGHQNAEAP